MCRLDEPWRRTGPRAAALSLLLLAGCDPSGRDEAPTAARASPGEVDKASLFGDARLVPSRAGERARLELALAGQIRALLEPLRPDDASLAVNVELSGPGPARVVVVAAGAWPADLEASADRLVSAVVPGARLTLVAAPATTRTPAGGGGAPWPLALALLGLGVSLGVFVERAAARGALGVGRLRPAGRR